MLRKRLVALAAVVACFVGQGSLWGAGPGFRPDITFTGSSLAGWQPSGAASWRASDGELIGTPKDAAGGWLTLDRPYQDVAFYASFRCAQGCTTGLLFRAEKTATGMRGIYLALSGADLEFQSVTLDAQGSILTREPMRRHTGQLRIAPPPPPSAPANPAPPARPAGMATPPLTPPDTSLKPGEWNTIEVYLDANVIRAHLNNGGQRSGIIESPAGGFGPLALHVSGAGEVRFKDVGYKNLNMHVRPAEALGKTFKVQRLSDFYYGWGAGATDVDHDGVLDVVAGPHVFYGPDFTKRTEIYLQVATSPSNEFAQDDWMQFVSDFTGDGWGDALNCSFSASIPEEQGCFLFVNPKGEPRRWDWHRVVPAFQTEVAVLKDIDGDGAPELAYGAEGQMRYAKPDPAKPTGPWIVRNVSARGLATAHGVGIGDINGDGRMDLVNPFGWWEQPAAGSNPDTWDYHPEVFGRYGRNIVGGSVMGIYDVNGDGLNDVVTVLNPHGWGLAWFEQKRDPQGKRSFERHMIMDDHSTKNAGDVAFSQPHGTAVGDMDGDGIPDFVVGKRYWSHSDSYLDPDPYGPAVLYVFKTVRNPKAPGGAELVPELVHNQSGAGSDVLTVDLNKDGRLDIVTATRFGTFIFWGQPRK